MGSFTKEQTELLASLPKKRIWLHGASMGDLLALKPTAQRLKNDLPDHAIIFTTMTNSGMAFWEKQLTSLGPCFYLPYDLVGPVERFINAIKPSLLVLEYTELWPVLISRCKNHGIKIALHNGRISTGNLFYYRTLFLLTGNLFQKLDSLMMRSGEEAARALKCGAQPEKVRVTGNTKYDNLNTGLKRAQERALFSISKDASLLVFGSIHHPEIDSLLTLFSTIKDKYPNLALAIAPRYVEHIPYIESEAKKLNIEYSKRSQNGHPECGKIFLLDTFGELMDLYFVSTLVFVGGSFCPRGGQNILEPAICGKPVLFGPYMDNFQAEVNLLKGHGALQESTFADLQNAICSLLDNPEQISLLGASAKEIVTKISGAADRNTDILKNLVNI